jgi:AcrR family transcriptional regulator
MLARDAVRRREIVEAARACFLRFGYAKTSLDDIAREAGLSRPLIYRKYRNKEEIFAAVFESVFGARYPAAEAAANGAGSKRDRLFRVHEILLVDPWNEVVGAPMAAEFYALCEQLLPAVQAKYERTRQKCTQQILGDKELTEVFNLAVDGLAIDLPSPAQLRKRLRVLVERFTP